MKIRKILLILSFLLLIVSCTKEKQDKSNIAVTIYPFKSIVQEIVGNKVKIDVLLPAGADPHTYEMSPSDLMKIQNAKVFFYGAESLDGWVAKIETESKIELLKLIPKEFLIDIKTSNDHSHHSDDHNHYGVDPHFWTDPLTVNSMLDSLAKILSSLYSDYKEYFRENSLKFSKKLVELDKKIREQTKVLENTKVYSAHPFYNYFFNRYGIEVVGSLEISPGQQITPKFLKNVSEEISRKNVQAIFINKQHISKSAQLLAEDAKINLVELDPMGGMNSLITYEDIIISNLNLIIRALR